MALAASCRADHASTRQRGLVTNDYMPTIQIATMPSEIDRCFPVMRQLRPMLIANEFVGRIQTQQAEGYQLAFLEVEDVIVSVAGFRVQTLLWSGKTLYVDDL